MKTRNRIEKGYSTVIPKPQADTALPKAVRNGHKKQSKKDVQVQGDVMSPEVRALADSLDRFSCVVTRAVGLLRFMPDEFWNIAESNGVSKYQMDIVESFGFLGDDSADLLNAALEEAWDKLMPIRVKDAQRKRD